jgi:hypothetical protein
MCPASPALQAGVTPTRFEMVRPSLEDVFMSWSRREGTEMVFWVALRKELLEQWRSYRFLIVGVACCCLA